MEFQAASLEYQVCTLGKPCLVTLSVAAEIGSVNSVAVLADSDSCPPDGDSSASWVDWTGYDSTPTQELSTDSEEIYNLGTPITGEPAIDLTMCWLATESDLASSVYSGDDLRLYGPTVGDASWPQKGWSTRCILGLECVPRVNGKGLYPTSAIVFLAEGTCGSSDAQAATWAGDRLGFSDAFTNPVGPTTVRTVDPKWLFMRYNLGTPFTHGGATHGPRTGYVMCWNAGEPDDGRPSGDVRFATDDTLSEYKAKISLLVIFIPSKFRTRLERKS